MKTPKLILLMFMSLAFILNSGCEKDTEEEEASPFIGNYLITYAQVTEPLVMQIVGSTPIAVPTGFPVTDMIQDALLGAIECTPENSLIELWEDNSLHISCKGTETELDGGTWEEVSETVVRLNLNTTAIPNSSTGVTLEVKDITWEDNVLRGVTEVPLAAETLAGIVAAMTGGVAKLDMEKTGSAVPLVFSIEMTKQ